MSWELSLNLLSGGYIGFIVPAAAVCTNGFAPLRNLLTSAGELTISSYGDNSGNLFKGISHSRLSIILLNKGANIQGTFTTKYNKWWPQEGDVLFQNLAFVDSAEVDSQLSIAKLGNNVEKSILDKFRRKPLIFTRYSLISRRFAIYYTRKLSHFVQVLNFIPLIYDSLGNRRNPSELKEIWFENENTANAILGFLNSSLFFWLTTIHSDCRNLNRREIWMTRFDLSDEQCLTQLAAFAEELMVDIGNNSRMLNYGKLTIQATFPRHSKHIIDEIDRVLAKHYGFTDEELDFIINYDIKYRMGLRD